MSATSSDRNFADSTQETVQAAIDRRRGRWVPWIIALFYMAFMAALIRFVFIAYAHPPAESTAEAYEKGLAYNDTLAKANAQTELGWQSEVTYERGRLTFNLKDRSGKPIEGVTAKAWFVHPGNPKDDRSFDLSEDGSGVYFADAPLPTQGMWTIHVTAEKGGNEYQAVATAEIE
jgi:nitrogen fixation protein FixH